MPFSSMDTKAFQLRLQNAVKKAGGNTFVAKKSGLPLGTLNNYLAGKSDPTISRLFSLAEACGFSLDVLIGLSEAKLDESLTALIPRYEAHLSAGDGHWNEGNAKVLDYIPFTKEFLKKKLNRKSASDLMILEASGDSMLPTIAENDLVLVDKRVKRGEDGIYAFVQDGFARVKRFRFLTSGGVEIVSDNKKIYSPEVLSNAEAQELHFIGRVRWIGHTV